ncbi:serine/arginine repetitive matrix protein 2-like [Amphibalanus amphitrite]|uniref:serine/arginine repetitive matrix protein 2-like n=1 Tax=Amphibalanus amphitrite TaxID=1232801 RepID=UPI001C9064B5|nr:serine/arginine repetitive matrix protein 2-like [Amphibalanus amphitrite]
MALRLNKPRDVEKASYYVWFLGALESRGLRGREFIAPVVDELLRKEQHVEPTKVTLQVSDKGLKIVQHVPKKGGKGRTEPVKHFIPDHAITCALQEPAPDQDIVSCILLIFNPVTKCPVHVHTYRCDSPETAALLASQLQTLAGRPDNRAHIEQIEARLQERGLLAGPAPPEPPPPEPEPGRAESAPSSGGSGSASGAPPVATLFDSLAAELRTKIGSRDTGPLLLPPRDYDLDQTAGRTGHKHAVQEDSSGIGSDDAPSPDHRDRDRERTSSDDEWEAAAHSTDELLLDSSSHWRQGSGWRGGRRSAGGQSPDTDELLTSGHSSSRKPPSQRQRSPSTSPQDRFNNARLKFVQMEQKEVTPPPAVAPKKPTSPGIGVPEHGGGRIWRQNSVPDAGGRADPPPASRDPRAEKGWRMPQPDRDEPRDPRNVRNNLNISHESRDGGLGEPEKGWRRPRASRADSAGPEPPAPLPPVPAADPTEEDLRRDARGRPHVADIFRRAAPDELDRPRREPVGRPEPRPEYRPEVRADHRRHEDRGEERVRGAVRTGRHVEPPPPAADSAPFPADSDPRPDEVRARVDRWVRSAAEATPFTRAMSFEDPAAAPVRVSRAPDWSEFEPEPVQEPPPPRRQPAVRRPSEASDAPRPGRLAKSRSSDTGLESEQAQWRRTSAQVAAELRQRGRAPAEQPSSPPPAGRHRSGGGQPAERRSRYQELQGASRLPGLDRDTARDPLLPPAEPAGRHRPTLEIDYRQNLPRRRDRSCDVRERRPAPAREQRRDESRPRGRYQDDPRLYRDDEPRHQRAEEAPPAAHGYGDRRGYPKPGFEVRGRVRHSMSDPHAMTQYDYRAGVVAHPY